jgi:hypothetical protein
MDSRVVSERHYLKSDRSVLYINIIIHDASGAIGNKIRAKVDGSKVPNRLKNVVTSAATSVAGNIITPAIIAKKLGQKLCQKMPKKMLQKGITAVVEELFREGPYVVFQLQVQHVNLATLTESKLCGASSVEDTEDDKSKKKKDDDHTNSAKKGEIVDATLEPAQPQDVKHWFMHLLELFFQLIGVSHQRILEEDVLPDLIHRKLESAMGEILAEKMGEKFLDAESKVCLAANQARYFFDKLEEVRKSEDNNN